MAMSTSAGPSRTISLQALLQRLSLLASIELPCAVQWGNIDQSHCHMGPVRSCGCSGGRFWLSIESFTLQLYEAAIDSVRLCASIGDGRPETCIDILSANGNVMARIKSAPDQATAAVWQDIMDTFDCA